MNKEFLKFAKQAGIFAETEYPGSFAKYDPNWFDLYNHKFAELILKECLDVALYGDEFEQARTNIKTLFGVE